MKPEIRFYVVNGEILVDCKGATPYQVKEAAETFERELHKKNVEEWLATFWDRINNKK